METGTYTQRALFSPLRVAAVSMASMILMTSFSWRLGQIRLLPSRLVFTGTTGGRRLVPFRIGILLPLTPLKKVFASGRRSVDTINHRVTTTVFWVGEGATADNGFIPNAASAWDEDWQGSYGGVDSPTDRSGFFPAGFTPKENPFYVALPYSDSTADGSRKASATACPQATALAGQPYSWCKNSWVMVTCEGRTAYAQWEDVGPYEEDDASYVFGTARPRNQVSPQAGLDVSPGVRDYLHMGDVGVCEWRFVSEDMVPDGPWRRVITRSKGYKIIN